MSRKTIITSLAIVLFVAACGEQKKLHEMHDSTQNMEQTTQKMSDTTKDLKGKTDELAATTDELYDALRQGNALQLRREAWNSLLQAPSMFRKISEAAKYFMSFEFQLWNKHAQDVTVEKRNILSQQAAKEFFMEIEELAPEENSINVTAQADGNDINSEENKNAAFNAMAISMSQINRKQLSAIEGSQHNIITMYSLMEEALLAKSSLQKGTANLGTKEPFVREILAHEAKAIQLLQTRYNIFPLMLIEAATHISEQNILTKIKMATFGWELDLDKMNAVQLDYYQKELLDEALRARDLMLKLGIKPELDSTLARLLSKMQIKSSGDAKNAKIGVMQLKLVDSLKDIQKGK